jgi:hypothetical protein
VAFRRNSRRIVDALVYIPSTSTPAAPTGDTQHRRPAATSVA